MKKEYLEGLEEFINDARACQLAPHLTWVVEEILISKIRMKPKKVFDLTTLLADISEHGLMSPIRVRRRARTYLLRDGHRRVAVYRELGLEKIEAMFPSVKGFAYNLAYDNYFKKVI